MIEKVESEEQGAGGYIQDDHGAAQPSLRNTADALNDRVNDLMSGGMSQEAAMGLIGRELARGGSVSGPSAVQAFQAGGELARHGHELAEIKSVVYAHNTNLDLLNQSMGHFRDKVIKPIAEELKFLRYNLGDKANVTVSQMQGQLTHMDKLFNALAMVVGKDPTQIAAIRIACGIPENIPSLEQLEAEGRPGIDLSAMQVQIEGLAQQNQRLLDANEAQVKRHAAQIETLIARIQALEAKPADEPAHP